MTKSKTINPCPVCKVTPVVYNTPMQSNFVTVQCKHVPGLRFRTIEDWNHAANVAPFPRVSTRVWKARDLDQIALAV